MLRYKADLRTLGFVFFYFAVTLILWATFDQLSWYVLAPLIAVLCWASFICAIAVHNTAHVPIFKHAALNALFQFVISFSYGHPISGLVAGHNFSHHRFFSTPKDIARPSQMRFKWNLLNQFLFLSVTVGAIMKTEFRWALKMKQQHPRWFYQYVLELLLVYGVKIVLLIVDYKLALLLVFLPHQFAQWALIGTNYWQHDGCDPKHPFNHSRNFHGKLMNYFFLNNGYHGLHHDRPGLHWSLLAAAYEQDYVQHVHPNLNRASLISYWFESYIYPGKRIDYLGNPVKHVSPEKDTSEDWVKEVSADDFSDDLGAVRK